MQLREIQVAGLDMSRGTAGEASECQRLHPDTINRMTPDQCRPKEDRGETA